MFLNVLFILYRMLFLNEFHVSHVYTTAAVSRSFYPCFNFAGATIQLRARATFNVSIIKHEIEFDLLRFIFGQE